MNTDAPRRVGANVLALIAALVLAFAGVLALPSPAHAAATWTVTDSIDDPDTTVGSLRWAVANAASGDTVDFAAGVSNIEILAYLYLPAGITIDGGGDVTLGRHNSGSYVQLDIRPDSPGQSYTIQNITLAGNPGGDGMAIQVEDGGIGNDSAVGVTLDNVTIHNESALEGAGIRVSALDGPLFINESTFTSNHSDSATHGGGAVYVESIGTSSVSIQTTTFTTNSAVNRGGAVYIDGAGPVVISDASSFDTNTSALGGAAYIASVPSLSVLETEFLHNAADTDGGAIEAHLIAGGVDVTDSEFTDNHADDGNGGGMWVTGADGRVTVRNTTMSNNTAAHDKKTDAYGGALALTQVDGGFEVTGGAFESNGAFDGGGAISVDEVRASSSITGATFTHNSAGFGGAIWAGTVFSGTTLSIAESDFTENDGESTGLGNGGGAVQIDFIVGTVSVTDSTFVRNGTETGGYGGAVHVHEIDSGAHFDATRSTFTGNSADVSGAALYFNTVNSDADVVVDSSTFSENLLGGDSSSLGLSAAIDQLSGEARVVNSTFDEQSDDNSAGVIFVGAVDEDATLSVGHSTLRGAIPVYITTNGGVASVSNSSVQDPLGVGPFILDGGSNRIALTYDALSTPYFSNSQSDGGHNHFGVADFKLGDLADNGGPTQTRLPQTDSILVNNGDPAFVAPPATDQRGTGFDRKVGVLDIGAVEIQSKLLAATGGTINPWIPIGGGLLLLLGVGAIVFTRVRRKSLDAGPKAEDSTTR